MNFKNYISLIKKIISYLILIFALVCIWQPLNAQHVKFEHIDNLPSKDILDVVKDKYGFIWVAHESGVTRYDGYEFVEYDITESNPNKLGLEAVWDTYIDKKDRLWVGGGNNGCSRYNYAEDKFYTYSYYDDGKEILKHVKTFVEDKNGTLWVGALGGIYYYNEEEDKFIKARYNSNSGEGLGATSIQFMYIHDDGVFWMGDSFKNIFLYDVEKNELSRYKEGFFEERGYEPNNVLDIFKDSKGMLWVSGENVAVKINPETNEQESFEDKIVNIKKATYAVEDSYGNMWFSAGGISIYNPNTGEVKILTHNDQDPSSLSSDVTNKIFIDNQGIFWIGTWYGGINIYNSSKKPFVQLKSIICDPSTISNNIVHCFYEDDNKDIWIGTEDGVLNRMKPNGEVDQYIDPGMTINEAITGIAQGKGDDLILGTWGSLKIFNKKSKTFRRVIEDIRIPSLMNDTEGRIWFGATNEGLVELDLNTLKTLSHTKEAIGECHEDVYFLRNISHDSYGNVWVVAWAALVKYNIDEKCFYKIRQNSTDPFSLPDGQIYCCYQDSKERIWIGHTKGIGLYNISEDYVMNFGHESGLKGFKVNAIVEDSSNNLWLSTDKGISKFCLPAVVNEISKDSSYIDSLPSDFVYFYNYNEDDGIDNERFMNGGLRSSAGDIYFGGTKGINVFNPERIKPDSIVSPVRFIELSIFNNVVKPRNNENPDSPLEKNIILSDNIKLSHNQYVFSVKWSALNYYSTHKVEYKYMLEGLENKWSSVGNQREANFTGLQPGQYTLRVKSTNADGLWSNDEATLQITILPPWWGTWWFRIAFGILIISIAILFYTVRIKSLTNQKKNLQTQVDLRTKDLQQANAAKDKFFSIIAHDLKNPFNIILGYSNLLLTGHKDFEEDDKVGMYKKIYYATEKTHNLLDNLLTWSRSQSGKINYKPENFSVDEFICNNIFLQHDVSKKKEIKVEKEVEPELFAYADLNTSDTILRNLLSNAIKFTNHNGNINVIAKKAVVDGKNYVHISVQDNGVGMSEEVAKSLFAIDKNTSTLGTDKEQGTGLGLVLCKEFTVNNGGEIWVESKLGKGSIFTFILPEGEKLMYE